MSKNSYSVHSIGTVRRNNGNPILQIDEEYRTALKGLMDFSHAYVIFWASHFDDEAHRATCCVPLPYAEGIETGVFANRSPVRPNPILVSLCKIVHVDEVAGIVQLNDIDAFNGTPILDLKPYYPVTDRVEVAHIPNYLHGWPEWFPEEGIGLMPHES